MTPSCIQPKLSLYLNNISYVSILVYNYQRRLRVSVHTAPMDAVLLCLDRTLEEKVPLLPVPQGSLSISSRTRLGFPGPRPLRPHHQKA